MLRVLMCGAFWLALAGPLQAAQYGEAVPAGAAIPLAKALADADDSATPAPAALFTGRVVEVCQNKGCWAMLEDNGQTARLMMHDHAFSLPVDYRGAARVLGRLQRVELSAEAAQHLAEDAGRSVAEARIEYRIDTLGIELTDQVQ